MGLWNQVTRAIQAFNSVGTGSTEDPKRTAPPKEVPGDLRGTKVVILKRNPDDTFCFLVCKGKKAKYYSDSFPGYMGDWRTKGVVLDSKTLEPMRIPNYSFPYAGTCIAWSDKKPTCTMIIPAAASTLEDDPEIVYDLARFADICEDPDFGDGTNTVWPVATNRSCVGEYTRPTPGPMQTTGLVLTAVVAVAVPIVGIALGLAYCYKACRDEYKKIPSNEKTSLVSKTV